MTPGITDFLDPLRHRLIHGDLGNVSVAAADITPGILRVGVTIPASQVTAGTFAAGNFVFPGILEITGIVKNKARGYFWDGIELGHASSTPYIDFHRSSNPEEATDYDIRLINDASGLLTIQNSVGTGKIRTPQAQMGAYNNDNSWAHFGHRSRMDLSASSYAFMHHGTTGETIINSEATTYLRSNGAAERIQLTTNGVEWQTTNWARNNILYLRSPGDTAHAIAYNATPNGVLIQSWDRTGFYRGAGGGWVAYVAWNGIEIEGGACWASMTNGFYNNKNTMAAGYETKGVRLVQANNGVAGFSAWVQPVTALNFTFYGPAGGRWRCLDYPEGAHVPIAASAFEVNSTIRVKNNVRNLDKSQKYIKKLRPVKFQRNTRPTRCVWCDSTGQVSPAEWMVKSKAGDLKIDSKTPAYLQEKVDCPNCSQNGTPGHINSPTIDKNEDTDFMGFIAEEIAEWAPEAVVYTPSNPDDFNSEPIPEGIDLMALVALLAQEVKDLDERVDELEKEK